MTNETSVGVVGLGYVGLPLALAMVDSGYEVVGVDVDSDRVEAVNAGRSYIGDVTDSEVEAGIERGLRATTDYSALASVSGVSICVPTPLRKSGTPDLSFVMDSASRIADVVQGGCTIVLESTVYPGATEEVLGEELQDRGFTIGEDVFLAFSPERIDPGNEAYGPTDIPKVVGGVTPSCGERAEALYGPVFDEVVLVDSATEAELVKLLENTFRAVNIGLINELAQVADRLDVDIWNVIDAAATKPFGFMPFYPGPGLGGHCIPVDPFYLSWKANQHGIQTRFIELADVVNREMPRYVVRRLTELLNDAEIPLPLAEVLLVGVAYKPDVSDTRESPAYDVIGELATRGANVTYHDPHVPEFEVEGTKYQSVSLTDEVIQGCDCVVILTDHSTLDLSWLVERAPRVFDTRNATAGLDQEKVIRL